MGIDYGKLGEVISEELSAGRRLSDSMGRLIDFCESGRPHSDWQRFRELPYDNLSSLQQWIVRPFLREPPTEMINGLWFGLFNPVIGGEPVADLYVCGSTHFDAKDETFDWACDPEWWPEFRYARSEILAEIYRIAYQPDGLNNDAEYPLCTLYASLAVLKILSPVPEPIAQFTGLGVGVGYDGGGGRLLGVLGSDGVQPIKS